MGLLPLLPFLVVFVAPDNAFVLSAAITALTFFGVGVVKGRETHKPLIRSGLETLLTGGAAATLAYLAGRWLQGLYG